MTRLQYQTLLLLLTLPFLTSSIHLPPCSSPDLNTPLWTLSDWTTDFTRPDAVTVIFGLSNTLTGYSARCFRDGIYPEGYCVWTEGGTGEGDDTGTLFTYYERVGELSVYQEWSCAAENGTTRVQVDGKVMVTDQCRLGDGMKKGEMCGLQGGKGVIYANLVQFNPIE